MFSKHVKLCSEWNSMTYADRTYLQYCFKLMQLMQITYKLRRENISTFAHQN